MHQSEIFVTESKYNKLCNMVMAISWANKNDPNVDTSSQTYPNTCSTEDRAKEKLFLKKNFTGAMPFVGLEPSAKKN